MIIQYSPIDLALFSGATWNPHRIHLDSHSARTEGLDEIVVQSHLPVATVLMHLDRTSEDVSDLSRLSWQNQAPIYAGREVDLEVRGGVQAIEWHMAVASSVAVAGRFEFGPLPD